MIAGWRELFCPGGAPPDFTLPRRIVRKRGEPLLLLPPRRTQAAWALELYPAQTPRARVAHELLRWALGAGIPVPLERFDGPVCEAAPFVHFLRGLAGEDWKSFAVFLGNPRAPGRRWLLLVFAPDGTPQLVVKVGAGADAAALIASENRALAALPTGTRGLPTVRDSLTQPDLGALAFDFAAGYSPRPADDAAVFALLRSWLDTNRQVRLADLPVWQRLEQSAAVHPCWPRLVETLTPLKTRSCVYHGDFAPWNLRGTGMHWRALDWERGELQGVPGWDALHYLIQRAVLVEHRPTPALLLLVEQTLQAHAFAEYLDAASLARHGDEIALSYLLHVCFVLRPTEGLPALEALLTAWAARRPYARAG